MALLLHRKASHDNALRISSMCRQVPRGALSPSIRSYPCRSSRF
jgi:hypothetical protein